MVGTVGESEGVELVLVGEQDRQKSVARQGRDWRATDGLAVYDTSADETESESSEGTRTSSKTW